MVSPRESNTCIYHTVIDLIRGKKNIGKTGHIFSHFSSNNREGQILMGEAMQDGKIKTSLPPPRSDKLD